MIRLKTVVNKKRNQKVQAAINALKDDVRFDFGIFGAKAAAMHGESGQTVGQIAARHEMGLGVPKRPWLSTFLANNEKSIIATIAAKTRARLRNTNTTERTYRRWLNEAAYKFGVALQEHITKGNVTPALSASTVKRKGFDIPLVDTAQMVNAIDYAVRIRKHGKFIGPLRPGQQR